MKVSVVTPNYNGVKFLKNYFDSLNETGHAGKASTEQGGEAERRAEETAGGTAAASELRRQTSFGSAADELERAIAEMRGRPEGRRAQDESERASS